MKVTLLCTILTTVLSLNVNIYQPGKDMMNFESEPQCNEFISTINKADILSMNTEIKFYSESDCVGSQLGDIDRSYTFGKPINIKSFMLDYRFKEPIQKVEMSRPPPHVTKEKSGVFVSLLKKLFLEKRNKKRQIHNKTRKLTDKQAFKKVDKFVKKNS